jgi:polyphosphate kinase 2 (PPK2 family)
MVQDQPFPEVGTTAPGVEYAMGFCTKAQYQAFLENCPKGESFLRDMITRSS